MHSMLEDSLLHWIGIFRKAVDHWLDAQAFVYAASLAFFTVFSIAPVVIVAVTIVGLVLGEQAATGKIMSQLQEVVGHDAAQFVQSAVMSARIEQSGIWPTVVGITLILVGATTVFAQMQKSLNAIWDVLPSPTRNSIVLLIKARMLSLTVVLAFGFILLVSLLMWVNYSSLIMLFGAAFTRAHLEARGRSVVPRRTAVRVHRQLVQDAPSGTAG